MWMSDTPGHYCQIRAKKIAKINGTKQNNKDISTHSEFWVGLLPMAIFEI